MNTVNVQQQYQLVVNSVMRRLKHQVKEKEEQKDTPASGSDASDPSFLHLSVVKVRGDGVVRVFSPPSQHGRVAVAGAVEVGELKHTRKDDSDGVAKRGQYRQPTQEGGETFGQVGGVESGMGDATVIPHFGEMGEVTGQ